MQFAINTPNFGSFSDVRLMAELAHEAEDAGWDGFFVWDHIGGSPERVIPMVDPWVALTAMVMTTSCIKLGPIVTPCQWKNEAIHAMVLPRHSANEDGKYFSQTHVGESGEML